LLLSSRLLHLEPHRPVAEASAWIERWSHLVEPGATVLDVACGSGRHVRWFVSHLAKVTGVDRDAAAVAPLENVARIVVADIENDAWPLRGETFDAVIVTNYLWRPLLPTIVESVAPRGLLLYETFGHRQPEFGSPKRPDFLLRPRELLEVTEGMRVLAYEDLVLDDPKRHVQRVAAMRGER
jgi:SAM-dependent methyltransferase